MSLAAAIVPNCPVGEIIARGPENVVCTVGKPGEAEQFEIGLRPVATQRLRIGSPVTVAGGLADASARRVNTRPSECAAVNMLTQPLGHPAEIAHCSHAGWQIHARGLVGQCADLFPSEVLHALDAAIVPITTELHVEVDVGVDKPFSSSPWAMAVWEKRTRAIIASLLNRIDFTPLSNHVSGSVCSGLVEYGFTNYSSNNTTRELRPLLVPSTPSRVFQI